MYKKIDLDKLIIYDIETLKYSFIANFRDYKTGTKKEFIIFNDEEYKEQPEKLIKFIRNCVRNGYTFLGFNNIGFDAQIIDFIINDLKVKELSLKESIDKIYEESQRIINLPEFERFKSLISEKNLFAPQIDLYKQLHYDRPAKATSLKWCQFSMQYPNIEEMPISHDQEFGKEKIAEILSYCWNDVDSTLALFEKVKYETEVRIGMSREYGINLINASEPRMVREIFATFLTKEMGISYSQLKDLKTIRSKIAFKDIIFPYIKFYTPEFNKVLEVFKSTVLDANPNSKETFKHTFIFGGMKIELGLGGIHACQKPGIYEPNEGELIEDADATSFYPMLAIKNDLKPEHLGKAFNKVYPMMFEERKKYDKKDPKNYIFKIILNSAYGLSKEINGYLYDPKFTYSITLNGQLSLLMLVEALSVKVPEIQFIQMNTDGITYRYNEKYREQVEKVCKWWQTTTKIDLEYVYYDKMVIRDVNNYLAIDIKGSTKKKGIFETEMAFHKNPSSLIIPKALENYFIKNIPIEDYVSNPKNSIFDYCNGIKRKSNFKINLIIPRDGREVIESQQKVTRYIVANHCYESGAMVKDFNDKRRISVESGKIIVPLNRIEGNIEMSNYPVNISDYIKETKKIVNTIVPYIKQTSLF